MVINYFNILVGIIISIVLIVFLTPLILRIIFQRAGEKDTNFLSIGGLFKWLKKEIWDMVNKAHNKIKQICFPTLQVSNMTSSLNEGPSDQRGELASKLLDRKIEA